MACFKSSTVACKPTISNLVIQPQPTKQCRQARITTATENIRKPYVFCDIDTTGDELSPGTGFDGQDHRSQIFRTTQKQQSGSERPGHQRKLSELSLWLKAPDHCYVDQAFHVQREHSRRRGRDYVSQQSPDDVFVYQLCPILSGSFFHERLHYNQNKLAGLNDCTDRLT